MCCWAAVTCCCISRIFFMLCDPVTTRIKTIRANSFAGTVCYTSSVKYIHMFTYINILTYIHKVCILMLLVSIAKQKLSWCLQFTMWSIKSLCVCETIRRYINQKCVNWLTHIKYKRIALLYLLHYSRWIFYVYCFHMHILSNGSAIIIIAQTPLKGSTRGSNLCNWDGISWRID